MLSMFVNSNQSDWDDQLPFVLMAYRSIVHVSIGCSQNLLMLNRECSFPIDIIAGNPPAHYQTSCPIQYLEWLTYIVNKTHEFAFKNLNQAASSQTKYYDVGLKVRKYKPNEFVWRWYPHLAGLKLALGWTGPYKVIDKLSSVTYKIQRDPKSKPLVSHLDYLKPYQGHGTPSNCQISDMHTVLDTENTDTEMYGIIADDTDNTGAVVPNTIMTKIQKHILLDTAEK